MGPIGLQEVTSSLELRELRDTKDNKRSLISVTVLEMLERFPINFRVFVGTEKSLIVITSVHTSERFNSMIIDWDPKKVTDDKVKQCMLSLPNWNWKKPFVFSYVSTSLEKRIKSIFECEELLGNELYLSTKYVDSLLVLEKEIPQTISPFSEYEIGELEMRHVPFIIDYWHYFYLEELEHFKKYFTLPSAAVFRKDEDPAVRNPVSWCVLVPFGLLGMVFTIPEERRKGLGQACISAMIIKLKALGLKTYISIDNFNHYSMNFHTKLGFKKLPEEIAWYIYLPRKCETLESFLNEE